MLIGSHPTGYPVHDYADRVCFDILHQRNLLSVFLGLSVHPGLRAFGENRISQPLPQLVTILTAL